MLKYSSNLSTIDPVTSRLKQALNDISIKCKKINTELSSSSTNLISESGSSTNLVRKLSDALAHDENESCDQLDSNNNNHTISSRINALTVSSIKNFSESEEEFFLDEIREWDLDDKLIEQAKYNSDHVKFFSDARHFDYKYIQENGFDDPLVFTSKVGLGMRVPSENFRISDVKSCIGSKRLIDIIDVNTQKALQMTMKDWCQYYENANSLSRSRLLNCISLEFSHTKLENYVESPLIVRQLDWFESAWPQNLIVEKMYYPKVQKYVLMSVSGCYTDFHVDMGGTSVWYHVLKGEKIFWLIPPTDNNLKIYEKWILSGNQSKSFLADLCDGCQRIVLKQGWTLMLPSGWIHAVYTSKDSLVFGGNFLHSFNIRMQLRVYQIETRTKVQQIYRYPYFIEMLWFVLERFVHCFSEHSSLNCLTKKEFNGLKSLYEFLSKLNENKRNLSSHQIVQPDILLESLKNYLDSLDSLAHENADNFANFVPNGVSFLHWPKPEKKTSKQKQFEYFDYFPSNCDHADSNLKYHKKSILSSSSSESSAANLDDSNSSSNFSNSFSSSTSSFFNHNINNNNNNNNNKKNNSNENKLSSIMKLMMTKNDYNVNSAASMAETRKHVMRNLPRTKGSIKKRLRPMHVPRSNVERRRRVRCHQCEPCTRDDCGECKYCKDMKKFGGTGVSKQCCLSKQCLQPLLPTTTMCMLCSQLINRFYEPHDNMMYECEICFEIYHEKCFKKKYEDLNGACEPIINEDLSNCWQCANCVYKGYIRPEQHSPSSFNASNKHFSIDLTPKSPNRSKLDNVNASLVFSSSFNCSNSSNSFKSSSFSTHQVKTSLNEPFSLPNVNTTLPNNVTLNSNVVLKKKRHRRTKAEIQQARLSETQQKNDKKLSKNALIDQIQTNKDYFLNFAPRVNCRDSNNREESDCGDEQSHFSLETLTDFQIDFIMNEFCELVHENSYKETLNGNKKSRNEISHLKDKNVIDKLSNDDDVIYIDTEPSSSNIDCYLDSSTENVLYIDENDTASSISMSNSYNNFSRISTANAF